MKVEQILSDALEHAQANLNQSVIQDPAISKRLEFVCRCISNRAGVRLLMSCLLAKIDRPKIDPRKPYTEIGTKDSFSGRVYDERYLTHFINENHLPCNQTTAFLTPALRNIDRPLTKNVELVGQPRDLYVSTLQLLDDVHQKRISAKSLLIETIRLLILLREEKKQRMSTLLSGLQRDEDSLPLSSEAIVTLVEQHLACKKASRLPVLIVAAAYKTAGARLGEVARPIKSHTAADLQTKAIGDVEVCLVGKDNVVTAYEMKMKRVTIDDIDTILQKIIRPEHKVHNYIIITTEKIEEQVSEHAANLYEETGGTEIAILDCVGFLRHFLHFFHRMRLDFLNAYQDLVLNEPESAISQPLKEAFLVLRQAAESDE